MRPSWDEYGLALAQTASLRGDCRRSKVGAVLMSTDHRIAATGYNGYPPNGPSCLAGQCPRGLLPYSEVPAGSSYAGNCSALHAEHNAILYADVHRRRGATLYVTREPCNGCRRIIERNEISRVVWPGGEYLVGRS